MRHPLAPALLVVLAVFAFGLLGTVATEVAAASHGVLRGSAEVDTLGWIAILTWGLTQLLD